VFVILAAVIALAAVGSGLGLWLGSGSGPPTSGLPVLWRHERPVSDCLKSYDKVPWAADGLAVMCSGAASLVAYRPGTGRVAWTWTMPKAPGVPDIDSLSTSTDDGIGVIQYTYGIKGAAYLAGIDVSDGRELWSLPEAPTTGGAIWVGDGRFIVLNPVGRHSLTGLAVYDLATGRLDWSTATRPVPSPAGCTIRDAAIAVRWIYAVTACSADRPGRLYQLSLQDGAVLAHAALHDRACNAARDNPTVWAVPGYVLSGCDAATSTGPDIEVIPVGRTRQIPLSWTGHPRYIDDLSDDLFPPDMAVSGNSLYLSLSLLTPKNQSVNLIAAIDLPTARMRWFKNVSIPGEAPGSVTYPVNLVGASHRGVLNVIENISSTATELTGSSSMTLSLLSASDGTMTYGPGSTYGGGINDQPVYSLDGHVLLSVHGCALAACPGNSVTDTITAYDTGSWPG
jgi:hypothetical protein